MPGAEVSSTLTRPRESRWRTRGGDWQCGGNRADWGDNEECAHAVSCVLNRAEICLKSNFPARAQDRPWGHILMIAAAAVTSQAGPDPRRLALVSETVSTDSAERTILDGVV